tara:strand:+ start:81 stop:224 length:144 start_codon:yes stop_codon:yes gene_type:complete
MKNQPTNLKETKEDLVKLFLSFTKDFKFKSKEQAEDMADRMIKAWYK